VITADGATIEMGADVYFRVCDAVLSVTNIQDLNYSTRVICQTSLQKHVAKKNLGDIENDRQSIVNSLQVSYPRHIMLINDCHQFTLSQYLRARAHTHTHTHTHPFNGTFPGLPG